MGYKNWKSDPKPHPHIRKAWQFVIIHPAISPDGFTQHATGSSVPLAVCWPWSGVCSASSVTAPTSNTNTQQSQFGSVADTAEAFPSTLNAADITESLASPTARSQRLGLALSNQWVDLITQTCTCTEKKNWRWFIWLEQDIT